MSAQSSGSRRPGNDTFNPEAALNALDDAYAAVATDWRVVFANPAFGALSGLGAADARGRELWQALPALRGASAAETLRASMVDRRPRTMMMRAPTGPRVELRITPLATGGLGLHFREVGERAGAVPVVDERGDDDAMLHELVHALAEEVDTDAVLRVICTEAMAQCDAAGATVAQLDGGTLTIVAGAGTGELAVGVRLPLEGSLTARAIERRGPARSDDYQREHPGAAALIAAFRPTHAMSIPLAAHRQVLGTLLVAREPEGPPFGEREERRLRVIADHAALALWKARLFDELQRANRTKSEFMATISHELRTPLTALAGYEELLADEVFGPLSEQQQNALERMRLSTELLTVIIDEILSFSRIEAGEEHARLRDTTAQEIAYAAMAVLEPLTLEKPLAFSLVEPDEDLPLRTDPDMVRRILVNVGANAIKFTERGAVTLEIVPAGAHVRFVVRDTGIGIAAEDLPRLFQPFTQLESGFTRRYGGTGLGLFISRRLAELVGGTIEVASVVGEGSTFSLVLPTGMPSDPP